MAISGQCLCGAVTYQTTAEPVMTGNCHCYDCKKASGSAYAPTLFFPAKDFAVKGVVKYYESKGSSGKAVHRGFCPHCGSQLFGKPAAVPQLIAVRAGSLDNLSQYSPQVDLYTSHGADWDVMDQNLPKFPEMPPQG